MSDVKRPVIKNISELLEWHREPVPTSFVVATSKERARIMGLFVVNTTTRKSH